MDLKFIPQGLPLGLRYGLGFIWLPEQDGQKNDSAPGETFKTSWGITEMTWGYAQEHGVVKGSLEDMTIEQAATVYLALYWNVLNCSNIPLPLAFCMFCDATLTGTGHVGKMVQKIVGANPDGVIGRKSLMAIDNYVRVHSLGALVDAEIDADEEYLESLANAPKFIRGWTRRDEDMRRQAHDFLYSGVTHPGA